MLGVKPATHALLSQKKQMAESIEKDDPEIMVLGESVRFFPCWGSLAVSLAGHLMMMLHLELKETDKRFNLVLHVNNISQKKKDMTKQYMAGCEVPSTSNVV